MTRDALLQKVRKLYAMAQGGSTEHERATALDLYNALCQKHQISIDELIERREIAWFSCATQHESRLLTQIICKVANTHTVTSYSRRKSRKIGVELTAAQAREATRLFQAYRAGLREEIERVFVAFIHANNIFSAQQRDAAPRELSQDEIADLRRMLAMSATIDPRRVNKELAS